MDLNRKRGLGGSGVDVTVLGLGGVPLGELYDRIDDAVARETVSLAHEGGVTLFDTSPFYGHGLSEHRFGSVLNRRKRDSFVLSTKVGRVLVPPGGRPLDRTPFVGGLDFNHAFDYSHDGTMRSVEQSMARLGLSRIDCLIIHDVDVWTHGSVDAYRERFRQSMEGAYPALVRLRSEGVVGAIGVGVNQIDACMDFTAAGDFDFVLLAGRYTLLEQTALDEFLPLCAARNIGVMLGGPYNSGILATGAVPGARYDYAPATPDIMAHVRRIEAVCARHHVPLAAAALQFPLGHPSVASVIPGAASPDEVGRNLDLMTHPIPPDLWRELRHERLLDERAPTPDE